MMIIVFETLYILLISSTGIEVTREITGVYTEAWSLWVSHMKCDDESHHLTVLTAVGTQWLSANTPIRVDQNKNTHAHVQRGNAVWIKEVAAFLPPCCIAAGFSPATREFRVHVLASWLNSISPSVCVTLVDRWQRGLL